MHAERVTNKNSKISFLPTYPLSLSKLYFFSVSEEYILINKIKNLISKYNIFKKSF